MISFFRNIRQKFLSESKFSKFLIYSIGEIVLVVIGILIAIQLDSWRDTKQQDLKTQHLNQRLIEQVIQNIDQAHEAIEATNKQYDGITTLMMIVGKPYQVYNPQKLDSLIYYSIVDYDLELNMEILNEARDNGSINSINNDPLRVALYNLTSIVTLIEQRIQIANTNNNNYMVPYFYKNISFRTLNSSLSESYRKQIGDSKLEKSNYEKIMMDREFENLLYTRLTYSEEMLTHYQDLLDYLEYTKQLLDKE